LEEPEAQEPAAIDITTMQTRTATDKKLAVFAIFLIVLRPKIREVQFPLTCLGQHLGNAVFHPLLNPKYT
jgi:hypothetical protein